MDPNGDCGGSKTEVESREETIMLLAEGLAQRSDAQKLLEQLTARAQAVARYQEGEPPAEDPMDLLARARGTVDQIENLVRRINKTNASTELSPGRTITDAIARRDALKVRRKLVSDIADAASGRGAGLGFARALRSELRYVTDLSVGQLRSEADRLAAEFRELDMQLQQANWSTELME